MKSAFYITLFLVAVLPVTAVGQNPDSRIQAARERLVEAGLQPSLVDVRIAEGRAKGVPIERIAAVVESRANAIIQAANALGALGSGVPQADLSAAADAVEAGIPVQAIQQVARAASAEDRPVAISVLTFLHRERNLPVDVALRNVNAAIQRGPDALRDLPAQTQNGRPAGPPGNAQGSGRPPAAGAAAPGQPPGGGPPSGVPGPQDRPGRGPGGSGPPGQNGPPGQ